MIIKEKTVSSALSQSILVVAFLGCVAVLMGWTKPYQVFYQTLLWQPIEVQLESLELSESQPSGIAVIYQYTYEKEHFSSQQLRASDARWLDADQAIALYSDLRAKKINGAVFGWVNPDNPKQAILTRSLLYLDGYEELQIALLYALIPIFFIWYPVLLFVFVRWRQKSAQITSKKQVEPELDEVK